MKILLVCIVLALTIAVPAKAGEVQMAALTQILALDNGVVFFRTSGARTGVPTCVTPGNESRFAMNANTDPGKAMLRIVLTAIARGKRVHVSGTNTCGVWGDTESAGLLIVED